MDGLKDVLGMWVGENESAKFWLSVMNGLKNRGVEDILIACIDGLTGFANNYALASSTSALHLIPIGTILVHIKVKVSILLCNYAILNGFIEFCFEILLAEEITILIHHEAVHT